MEMDEKLLVESALFSAGRALTVKEICDSTGLEDTDVRKHLKHLTRDYNSRKTAVEINKVGRKFSMQLKTDYTEKTGQLAKTSVPTKYIKTLALVAYYQPVTQSNLNKMIGPQIYANVKALKELGMITSKARGSTKVLSTTQKFVEYFGLESAKKEDIKKMMAEKVGIVEE